MAHMTDKHMLFAITMCCPQTLKNLSANTMHLLRNAVDEHSAGNPQSVLAPISEAYNYTHEWNNLCSRLNAPAHDTPWANDHNFINSPHVQLPLAILALCPFQHEDDATIFIRNVADNIGRVVKDTALVKDMMVSANTQPYRPSSRHQLDKFIVGINTMINNTEKTNYIMAVFDSKGKECSNTSWFAQLRSELHKLLVTRFYGSYYAYLDALRALANSELVQQMDKQSSESCAVATQHIPAIPAQPPCVLFLTRNHATCPPTSEHMEPRTALGTCRGGPAAIQQYIESIYEGCGNEGIRIKELYKIGASETKRVHQLALRVCHLDLADPVDIADDLIHYMLDIMYCKTETCNTDMVHRQLALFQQWQNDFVLPTFFNPTPVSDYMCEEVPTCIAEQLDDGFYSKGTLYVTDEIVQKALAGESGPPPPVADDQPGPKKARVVSRWKNCGVRSTESSSAGVFFINGLHVWAPHTCCPMHRRLPGRTLTCTHCCRYPCTKAYLVTISNLQARSKTPTSPSISECRLRAKHVS